MAGINASYKGISKDELYLLSRADYEGKKIITSEYAKAVYKNRIKAVNQLSRLVKKGRLFKIENGRYLTSPINAPGSKWRPNEFVTAKYWMGERKYYLCYYTMYNYWGFTGQIPQVVYVANTEISRKKIIGGIRYEAVKIRENRYYGITDIEVDGEKISVSDRERTLVDYVYRPSASFKEMFMVVSEMAGKIDIEKFAGYLIRYPEAAVRKRAGYIMEKAGVRDSILKKINDSIKKNDTYISLNPSGSGRAGVIDKKWRVIISG